MYPQDTMFRRQLATLLNQHSFDNLCNMHDFVLADAICSFLGTLKDANKREAELRGEVTTAPDPETKDDAAI